MVEGFKGVFLADTLWGAQASSWGGQDVFNLENLKASTRFRGRRLSEGGAARRSGRAPFDTRHLRAKAVHCSTRAYVWLEQGHVEKPTWEFPKIRCTLFWHPYNKDPLI